MSRTATADDIALSASFQKTRTLSGPFTITSYYRLSKPGDPLHVYIEGDGLAWISKLITSDDPTPINPLALRLAALDPATNVVYLARPCQYTMDAACHYTYWSSKRFSEPVIESMNEVVSEYVKRSMAREIDLIGYSGGAAVAVLIAERRSEPTTLRTVAGDLDPQGLNLFHKVSPLTGSLNPMDVAFRISRVPQRHFVGTHDTMVPPFVAQNFKRASEYDSCIQVTEVRYAEHAKGWEEKWKDLLEFPMQCQDEN